VLRGNESKTFSITRDAITNPSVKSEITSENIGILRLSRFGEDTAGLATRAAEDFKTKGVKSVIVDVRGNGGGYLQLLKMSPGYGLTTKWW
jgi:carboxyl-terminal processing protease